MGTPKICQVLVSSSRGAVIDLGKEGKKQEQNYTESSTYSLIAHVFVERYACFHRSIEGL